MKRFFQNHKVQRKYGDYMFRARELKNENNYSASHLSVRQHTIQPAFNSCGGCNACHEMTRIRSTSGIPSWSGDGGEESHLRMPCSSNLFQRNVGNSFLQSVAEGHRSSTPPLNQAGASAVQRKCNCGGPSENLDDEKKD
jgi:hypothetical protein